MTSLLIAYLVAGQIMIGETRFNSFTACETKRITVSATIIKDPIEIKWVVQDASQPLIIDVVCFTTL